MKTGILYSFQITLKHRIEEPNDYTATRVVEWLPSLSERVGDDTYIILVDASRIHAKTLLTASSSSGLLRRSALSLLFPWASFLFLYLSPAFRLSAERTAAGEINSASPAQSVGQKITLLKRTWIREHSCPTKSALEYLDRGQDESRTDFY